MEFVACQSHACITRALGGREILHDKNIGIENPSVTESNRLIMLSSAIYKLVYTFITSY